MFNLPTAKIKKVLFFSPVVLGFCLLAYPARAFAAEVKMYLNPSSATVAKDASQTVKVMLDSGEQEINSGEVYIEYDSAKVEIKQADISRGQQSYNYGAGTCNFTLVGTLVDSTKVRFGYLCQDDQGINQPFKGIVEVGSFKFKALPDSGSTGVNLKFIPGATAGDCNAAKAGVDYLTKVTTVNDAGNSGLYTFTAASPDEPDTYLDCVNNQCVAKDGTQSDNTKCSGKSAGDSCATSTDDGVHLECKNNTCQSVTGEQADATACSGKYAGSACTSTTTTTTTTTTGGSSGSKGGTSSAVPQTAGSLPMTILTALGAISLIMFSILLL